MAFLAGGGARPLKRFYKRAACEAAEAGFEVRLDDRPARTPQRRPLAAPTRALGEAIAAEWDAQEESVDLRAMPLTRLLTTALDRAEADAAAWRAEALAFMASDLLCYRAPAPEALRDRQTAEWDPYLEWASDVLSAPLKTTEGVMAIEQPKESLAAIDARLAQAAPLALLAIKTMAEIAGSLILALAVAEGKSAPAEAFAASQLDETFQAEQWGVDAEAEERRAQLRVAFLDAARFLDLARD